MRTYGEQPTKLLCPRASPGKNIGVGCHFLLRFQTTYATNTELALWNTRLSIPRLASRGQMLELLSFQFGSPFLSLLSLLTRFRTSALLSLRLHRRAYIPSLLNLGSWEYGLPLLSLSPNMPAVSTHTCLVYYTLDSASLHYWNCLPEQEFITCWVFTLKHKYHNNYLVAL